MISSNKETDIGTIHKTPPNGSEKIILHFHGGAYVAGTLEQYRRLHLMLSRNTGMRVYGFAYRLAPQSQFPTQLYDAYCALQHLREIGYKDRDIVLSGDSAGGNLVMALWQLTRAQLGALILLSPRVDVTSKRESWKQNASVDILPQYNLFDPGCSTRKLLAPEGPVTQELLQLLEDPFVSPIHADLKKMPRTLIQMGTAEVMYDDIREFARRATEQGDTGASIDLQVFRDGFHVFQAVPFVMNAERAWDAIGAFARSIQ
ncbi:alpha/beta-hydrolase [Martensiomyces pterosporus]|nr:alpha/beta-hydrolase [Martensiomyces pterosporus]